MKYDTLLGEIFKSLPELKEEYDAKSKENLIDKDTGVHVVFGIIIVPYLVNLLKRESQNDNDILKRAFIFFEEMARSNDKLIQEVLEFTVIESFIDEDEVVLMNAYKYMLSETREASKAVERFFNI